MIALLSLLACGSEPQVDPVRQALTAGDTLASCEGLAFEELVTPCRVSVAAKAAGKGKVDEARAACEQVDEQMWRQECWFQVGEALGQRGQTEAAAESCAHAGRFLENCVGHLAWGQSLPAGSSPEAIANTLGAYSLAAERGLSSLPEPERSLSLDTLVAGRWLSAVYGKGEANPALIAAAPEGQRPHARTAYAAEAVRLSLAEGLKPDAAVARMMDAHAAGEVLRGAPRATKGRIGRKGQPVRPEANCGLLHVPTFGGGARLVSLRDVDEDLLIAGLEALYLLPETPPQALRPWTTSPQDAVRWTATKLFALGGGLQREPDFGASLDDPVQQAYLTQADCLKPGASP